MIYLASPYSDPLREVRVQRYHAVMDFVAHAIRQQYGAIFSPILHCHEMSIRCNLPGDALFWRDYNNGMLNAARFLWVLRLRGWEQSIGVLNEIAYAKLHLKQIQYCDPV